MRLAVLAFICFALVGFFASFSSGFYMASSHERKLLALAHFAPLLSRSCCPSSSSSFLCFCCYYQRRTATSPSLPTLTLPAWENLLTRAVSPSWRATASATP
ncbi:hypothetical protein QOT17_010649 [Balamuthia mandrillaris]